jgi:hypothetical protein
VGRIAATPTPRDTSCTSQLKPVSLWSAQGRGFAALGCGKTGWVYSDRKGGLLLYAAQTSLRGYALSCKFLYEQG